MTNRPLSPISAITEMRRNYNPRKIVGKVLKRTRNEDGNDQVVVAIGDGSGGSGEVVSVADAQQKPWTLMYIPSGIWQKLFYMCHSFNDAVNLLSCCKQGRDILSRSWCEPVYTVFKNAYYILRDLEEDNELDTKNDRNLIWTTSTIWVGRVKYGYMRKFKDEALSKFTRRAIILYRFSGQQNEIDKWMTMFMLRIRTLRPSFAAVSKEVICSLEENQRLDLIEQIPYALKNFDATDSLAMARAAARGGSIGLDRDAYQQFNVYLLKELLQETFIHNPDFINNYRHDTYGYGRAAKWAIRANIRAFQHTPHTDENCKYAIETCPGVALLMIDKPSEYACRYAIHCASRILPLNMDWYPTFLNNFIKDDDLRELLEKDENDWKITSFSYTSWRPKKPRLFKKGFVDDCRDHRNFDYKEEDDPY